MDPVEKRVIKSKLEERIRILKYLSEENAFILGGKYKTKRVLQIRLVVHLVQQPVSQSHQLEGELTGHGSQNFPLMLPPSTGIQKFAAYPFSHQGQQPLMDLSFIYLLHPLLRSLMLEVNTCTDTEICNN